MSLKYQIKIDVIKKKSYSLTHGLTSDYSSPDRSATKNNGPSRLRSRLGSCYFVNGIGHRVGGPAIECHNGIRIWINHGKITNYFFPHHLEGGLMRAKLICKTFAKEFKYSKCLVY